MQSSGQRNGFRRVTELDGIRGWASLSVTAFHLIYMALGIQIAGFKNIVTASAFNGNFAVMIFFVLSGDALSTPYWQRQDPRLVAKTALKRYPRLTVPIVFSTGMLTVILASGLSFSYRASGYFPSAWFDSFPVRAASLPEFVRYVLWGVYLHPLDGPFIPFLWTMRTEMLGSILIFAFLFLDRWNRYPRMAATALAMLCWIGGALVACFFFGALIGRLRADGVLDRVSERRFAALGGGLLFAIAIAIAGAFNLLSFFERRAMIAVSVLALLGVGMSRPLQAFFSSRLSLWLGRISFPLYLTHFCVLVTFTCGGIVWLAQNGRLSSLPLVALGVVSLVIALIVAQLFIPLERLGGDLGTYIWKRIERRRPADPISEPKGQIPEVEVVGPVS